METNLTLQEKKEKQSIKRLFRFWDLAVIIKQESGKDWPQVIKTINTWEQLFYKKHE